MWQIWLIISGMFFILEMITVGFLVFWFAIGSLFAMITSFFTTNIIIQTTVFLITSTLLLFLTKSFASKMSRKDGIKTNAYSIIGKTGLVTIEINSKKGIGQVKIGSETWSAKGISDEIIPVGSEVEIAEISGVKVVVKPLLITATK